MTTRLKTILRTLSAEPRTEAPFFSLYLDWNVDSNGQRQSLQILQQALDRFAAEMPVRGPRRESFDTDRAAIESYLNSEVPLDAHGVVIFARAADNIWTTIPLMAPVENHIAADDYPHLYQLARLIDDYEPFILATVDGQEASVYALGISSLEHVEKTTAPETVNRVQVGGWSQLRYQNHTEQIIRAHMRDLASVLQQAMSEHDAQYLILAGNDSIKGTVRQTLPQQLQERMVEYTSYQGGDDLEQLLNDFQPAMREAERAQEQALVDRLHEQLNTRGGLAFEGAGAVAGALAKGQVDTLLISPSLEGEASECQSCGMLRVGRRESCPADGAPMLPMSMREALIIHTFRQGGNVEIINLEDGLAEHGHVAALLRYRDDVSNAVGDGIA